MNNQGVQRFLNPSILANIGNLELVAKAVVEGFVSGLHKSPYHGFSVEFSQYRQYIPGDDPKYIDWKIYGRTDRYYIKQFEEETNLNCHILLDTSESMTYGSGDLTKLEYASFLIASLSYFMIKQRDAVGFSHFDETIQGYLPAHSTPTHLHSILLMLEKVKTNKLTQLSQPLHRIAERLTKRGLVILISDLYDENPDQVLKALQHFRYDGHEVILFHILDHQELVFDFNQVSRFVDSETSEEIVTTPPVIRNNYQEALQDFIKHYRSATGKSNIDYNMSDTSTPLDFALVSYLAKREGLM